MTYTSPSDINMTAGITNILSYLNEVTNFWFSRMFVIAIFTIFTLGILRSKSDDDLFGALAIGSYVTSFISLLLWIIGFVDNYTFAIIIAITLGSSALLLIDRRGTN